MVHAFITSRIDTCNSLLYGLPTSQLNRLQRVQNAAARLVSRARKFDHITPVLEKLHWLPVKQHIVFKMIVLLYKVLQQTGPIYLQELIKIRQPLKTNLRSSNKCLLEVPRVKLSRSERSFAVAAPKLWNTLPQEIKNSTSVTIFKKRLKTLLFHQYFKK